jgi:hypothetical protein
MGQTRERRGVADHLARAHAPSAQASLLDLVARLFDAVAANEHIAQWRALTRAPASARAPPRASRTTSW